MSKGSTRRPEDREAVDRNWLRAFGKAVADEYFLGNRARLDGLCDSRITKTSQTSVVTFSDHGGVTLAPSRYHYELVGDVEYFERCYGSACSLVHVEAYDE